MLKESKWSKHDGSHCRLHIHVKVWNMCFDPFNYEHYLICKVEWLSSSFLDIDFPYQITQITWMGEHTSICFRKKPYYKSSTDFVFFNKYWKSIF